jgi:hypothetical protein
VGKVRKTAHGFKRKPKTDAQYLKLNLWYKIFGHKVPSKDLNKLSADTGLNKTQCYKYLFDQYAREKAHNQIQQEDNTNSPIAEKKFKVDKIERNPNQKAKVVNTLWVTEVLQSSRS